MERRRINLNFFQITWPIFMETFLRTMLGNVDVFMLSRFSDNAVAAVGTMGQIQFFIMLLLSVIATGTTILISQNLGARNEKRAGAIAVVSLLVNMVIGIILSFVMFFAAKYIVGAMGLRGDIALYAVQFLVITGAFSFAVSLGITVNTILRSYGMTKIPMYVNMGANVANIIGNYFAIFAPFGLPKTGVIGVAFSTAISQLGAAIISYYILKKRTGIKFSISKTLRELPVVKEILKIGVPTAGEALSYNTAQIAITVMLANIGPLEITARSYAMTIMRMIMMFSVSAGQGTQILVGYFMGAKRESIAQKVCMNILKSTLMVIAVVAVMVGATRYQIIGFFTSNNEIVELTAKLLLITVVLEIGRTFNLVIISALKGAGDVNFPVIAGVISMWGTGVGGTYILGVHFGLGVVGAWIAVAADEWLRGIIMFIRWKKGYWKKSRKKENITKKMADE